MKSKAIYTSARSMGLLCIAGFMAMCCAIPANRSQITFWYGDHQTFGQRGEPQRWINVLGRVTHPESIDSMVAILNGELTDTLMFHGDLHRLAHDGDFNIELDWDQVAVGRNKLEVVAHLKNGNSTSATTMLEVQRGRSWPLPYSVSFADIDNLQDVVQVVDGWWELTPQGVRTTQPYYDRVWCVGDTSWSDFDTRILLTIHGFTPSEPGPPTYDVTHFGVAMRWRGHHEDGFRPNRKWYPMGSQGELLLHPLPDSSRYRILFGSDFPTEYGESSFPVDLEKQRWVRTQVKTLPDGDTLYRYKSWSTDMIEPEFWHAEGIEPGNLDYAFGSLCIVPHNSDITVHSLSVVPVVD